MYINGHKYPAVFQLYENNSGHYRIFLFGLGNKMLTSVNLTNGLNNSKIVFDIQIKVTAPHSLPKEERCLIRDKIVRMLRENGLAADKKNHIEFGMYDITANQFINTNAEQLVKDLLIIGICKNMEMFSMIL